MIVNTILTFDHPAAKPKIVKKMETIEVFEGEVAKFTVHSTANPKARVEFYHEDELLHASKRVQIKEEEKGKFTLTLDNANQDDQGKYKCKIINEYGYEEDDANLMIHKKDKAPEFKDKLQDLEAKVNDEGLELSVKVDGQPTPAAAKWFHNGEPIKTDDGKYKIVNDQQGGSRLIIPKVMADHHGVYLCKSENPLGVAQTSCNLLVNGPPYVVVPLKDQQPKLGQDVQLTCTIKGNPTPQAQFFLDEVAVKLSPRIKYSYDEAQAQHNLTILKVQDSDMGEYKIVATNIFGKCSSTANVQTTSKPLFAKELSNVAVQEMATNTELVVVLDKRTPVTSLKWFKDDKQIEEDNAQFKMIKEKVISGQDPTYKLVVLKATEEAVGVYKCAVSNDIGTSTTSARFDLKVMPKFLKGLDNVEVPAGNSVSMTVKIAGFPTPDVSFYKDGQDVSAHATILVKKEYEDTYTIFIESISLELSGDYECRARNEVGQASSKGTIKILKAPKIDKDLGDLNVKQGEAILEELIISGSPQPDVKWFKDGKELKPTAGHIIESKEGGLFSLRIAHSTPQDAGKYHCVAINKVGEVKSKPSQVQVGQADFAPRFTKHLDANTIAVIDDSVRFEVEIVGSPPVQEVVWLKDGKPLKSGDKVKITSDGSGKYVLILKDVKLGDSGQIACQARNAVGSAEEVGQLEVHGE